MAFRPRITWDGLSPSASPRSGRTSSRCIAVALGGEPVLNIEISGRTSAHPNERHWLTSIYPVRVREDQIAGAGVIVQEITARKRAEQEREKLLHKIDSEKSRLAELFERSPAFMCVLRGPASSLNGQTRSISASWAGGTSLANPSAKPCRRSPAKDTSRS